MKKNQFVISGWPLFFLALIVLGISCDKDEPLAKGQFENGVYIVNEGTFQQNNGSVSFYYYNGDSVSNDIFFRVNQRILGDVVQSLWADSERAYIVVNNSNKLEVVNRFTFEEQGVLEALPSPRYFISTHDKGYLTCWGDNSVKVVDLNSLDIVKSIEVGNGPEHMLVSNQKLFVANSGAFGSDSAVSVINPVTDSVEHRIVVPYNPKSMVTDWEGNIWVLCAGKAVYDWNPPYDLLEESASLIYQIDPVSYEIISTVQLFEHAHPSNLQIDKNGTTLYFDGGINGGIYSYETAESGTPITKIIDEYAYGFAYDPQSDVLFVFDAGNYVSAGTMMRYSTSGNKLGEYAVGMVPNGASFKRTR